MDLNTAIAVVAAVAATAASFAAFLALTPAKRAAEAAEEQSNIQRELMRQAAQPYVWADIQPDNQQGSLIHLVLGNSGPTTARNVQVRIDPPLPERDGSLVSNQVVQDRLRHGIASIAPGRTIRWSLGLADEFIGSDKHPSCYEISVQAEGPYGVLEQFSTVVRPSDWGESLDLPNGSLHFIRKELQGIQRALNGVAAAIQEPSERDE